jgi:uncharacterized protein YhfF
VTSEQPGDVDRSGALAMWRQYVDTRTFPAPPDEEPWVGRFGDSPGMADELLALVLAGTKRATAGLVRNHVLAPEPLPRIGGHWVVCDGAGTPRCVLRTVELRVGRLDSVDDAFAWDEGEGDRSRNYWLEAHLRYFTRTRATRGEQWNDDLEVLFERFRVVWPPEVAG